MDEKTKLNYFLKRKEELERRLKGLQEKFKDEKENEEAWPGHESNFLQQLEQEYQLVLTSLENIERIIEKIKKRP